MITINSLVLVTGEDRNISMKVTQSYCNVLVIITANFMVLVTGKHRNISSNVSAALSSVFLGTERYQSGRESQTPTHKTWLSGTQT